MPDPHANSLIDELIDAFPFHLIFDFDLKIVQMEKSLHQLHSDLIIGGMMTEIFELSDFSNLPLKFEDLQQKNHKNYYLMHRDQPFCLKGQILCLKQSQIYVFLGTLIFDNKSKIECYEQPTDSGSPLNLLDENVELNNIYLSDISKPTEVEIAIGEKLQSAKNKLPIKNELIPWQEIINRIIGDLCLEFGWDLSVLWVFDHQQRILICRHVWGRKPKQQTDFEKETKKITFAPGVGLPGKVFAESKLIWIEDMLSSESLFPPVFAVKRNLSGATCFPIFSNRRIIGVLETFSHKPQPYNYKYITLLSELCGNIGSFIEGKIIEDTLLENLQKRKHELRELGNAKAANYQKSLFLANLSHEIRTPLNAVLGLSELLLETSLNGEQSEFLRSIQRNSENLLGLINEVLDFSKIEAGELRIKNVNFDFRKIVEDVIESLYFKAEKKGIALFCDIDLDLPEMLLGDPDRLRQVLLNLVGNAIKFTDHGKVIIKLKLKRINYHGCAELECSVADTGIGIAKKDQDLIFNKFTQVTGVNWEAIGGTGLGLNICKSLIESMGGNIWVESEKSKGTNFVFQISLPITKNNQSSIKNLFNGQRILVFNDKSTELSNLAHTLSYGGLEVLESNTIPQMLELLLDSANKTHILICEDVLPDETQYFLEEQMQSNQNLKGLNIVMFFPNCSSTNVPKIEFGENIHALYKPVSQNYLITKLCNIFASRTAKIAKAETLIEDISINNYRILVVEDNFDNQRVAITILQKAGYQTDLAENGQIALDKCQFNKYDLILTDLQMPLVNGFKLTKKLRESEKQNNCAETPIIALSAHAVKGISEKCLAAGMNDYLPKPLKKEVLLQKIEKFITSHPLILIADDSQEIRKLLENYLKHEKYRLLFAENGKEALEVFERNPIEMILLDMQMPIFNGFETMLEIRKTGFDKPIIALTGFDSYEEQQKCLTNGCSDYLLKPFDKRTILQTIKNNLLKGQVENLTEKSVTALTENDVIMIDPNIIDLVPAFLQQRQKDVNKLRELTANKNLDAIYVISHQMKGCGEGYGFQKITVLGKEMEKAVKSADFPMISQLTNFLERYLQKVIYQSQN